MKISCEDLNISNYCFSSCSEFETISFQNLKSISFGLNSFHLCKKLKKIDINSPLKIGIGDHCFNCCENLSNVILVTSAKIDIGYGCFYKAQNLVSASFTCEEINIGENSFRNCSKLSSISFSNIDKAIIGKTVFYECDKLTRFHLTASTSLIISEYSFSKSTNLREITLTTKNLIFNQYSSSTTFQKGQDIKQISFDEINVNSSLNIFLK